MATPAPATFAQLLEHAVNEPGILSNAYRQFHGYSIGNQLLALSQCLARGIQPGPIATFQRWKDLGRYVRRGEKAITLCRPVTAKRTTTAEDGTEEATAATWFVYRPQWFVMAQTDGKPQTEPPTPAWDKDRALATLDIQEVPFDALEGNCLGFARQRSIAINPVNPLPHKTRFHELAHVVLGHTAEGTMNDGELTPRNLREVEAESVALLCLAALSLPGVEFSRGYIQAWWGTGNPIPEKSAQRILKAADQILRAGTEQSSNDRGWRNAAPHRSPGGRLCSRQHARSPTTARSCEGARCASLGASTCPCCPKWCRTRGDFRPTFIARAGGDYACPLRTLFGHDVTVSRSFHQRERNQKGETMPRVVLTAEVENLEQWEKGFRTHGDLFRQMGVSKMEFGTGPGNRVAVAGETTNLDAYMKVFTSPATAEAMNDRRQLLLPVGDNYSCRS